MNNILNHNRNLLKFKLNNREYWDFHLSLNKEYLSNYNLNNNVNVCCIAHIDLNDMDCVSFYDFVNSKANIFWDKAINTKDVVFENSGYTFIDNGFISYHKDKISNYEFYDIFKNTKYSFYENGNKLTLYKVKGNHNLFTYESDITFWNDEIQSARLNGGWYQGFFATDKTKNYNILPKTLENGWTLQFTLNKEDFQETGYTLNNKHPNNKGIFFYIGTRSENKWWINYLTNHNFEKSDNEYSTDDYTLDDFTKNDFIKTNYAEITLEQYTNNDVFSYDYVVKQEIDNDSPFADDYSIIEEKQHNENYFSEEYIKDDLDLTTKKDIKTSEGYDVEQPNIKEIKTDNKFLLFDKTCNGYTINNFNQEDEHEIYYTLKPNIGNYFTLFDKTCNGYTIEKIKKLIYEKNKSYNVLDDLYNNALAFQIKDDGSIGFKYLVKDCENKTYKILSEFSKPNIIKEKEWHKVSYLLKPIDKNKTMIIIIYVDKKPVLISKKMPLLNLRSLNDLQSKQEGVAYNISLGGGTQGLSEVVYLNYLKEPEYTLPLEKEFGGSFIGWIKEFKFNNCLLNYNNIKEY